MIRSLLAIMLAAILSACSPPGILNGFDRLTGSGSGVERAVGGVPFGQHGQRLDVWRPSGPAAGPRPVLVFFYGGGWVKGARGDYGFAARAFAARGFVVVVPDYRKVPAVRFPAFVQDGAEAVKWTRDNVARFGGDPGRIALAGHSAGAYTVAMLALDQRWLRAVDVDPKVVRAGVGLSGPYDFYPFTSQRAIDAMQGVADPAMTQPVTFARSSAPPLLLVTSSDDTVVRPRNTEALAAALNAKGATVKARNYPGLTHEEVVMALAKPFRGKGAVLDDSVAFLDRELAR